ncbi:MAG TPA: NAD-dependent epimerase/dehydratase family protein [Ignavibacteriaceae bacterium]|nr:NAD-dependent epimerase/dehydratase family protein [Ignavibacteriaceae bacterium]
MKKILVTGVLGFIGYHLVEKLLKEGFEIVGIDNINSYYDVRLKFSKLPLLGINNKNIWENIIYVSETRSNFKFAKTDITDRYQIENLFASENFDIVVNFAAQAGVQYSLVNPHTYIENNITGFNNILDSCKKFNIEHFIYASSSSVYGDRETVPFKESDNVDNPVSLYAATKKSNELMAFVYSHLYNLQTTGLRFFTVYGPWGRPDMAPDIFVTKIMNGEKINVFNKGDMERDFTFVDDIVEGLSKVINSGHKMYNYRVYNLGNSKPVNLLDFISEIEKTLSKEAQIEYLPARLGDVRRTYADVSLFVKDFNYKPGTNLSEGIKRLVDWKLNTKF